MHFILIYWKLTKNRTTLKRLKLRRFFSNGSGSGYTGCPGPIFEISIANSFLLEKVRPIVPLSKKCPYGGTFCFP